MSAGVVWYGERGIVNALVTELASRKELAGEVQRLLAKGVCWAGGDVPQWLKDVSEVTFIVEVGMAQFGNPDLIVICRTRSDPSPQVVFVEAKVIPYLASAMSNETGMSSRGYNSSINGQLVLRHRLSHALAAYQEGKGLVEPDGLFAAYRRTLGDTCGLPRRLGKPNVLAMAREHGLLGIAADRCHFVAWTWDRVPFFAPTEGVTDADLLPAFLTGEGNHAWEEVKNRVGWIGFQRVQEVVNPGPVYADAVKTMVGQLVPSAAKQDETGSDPLPAENVSHSEDTVRRVKALGELAQEQIGADCRKANNDIRNVQIAGRVRGKIIPWRDEGDEHILLGIRSNLSPQDWCPADLPKLGVRSTGKGKGKGVFHLLQLPDSLEESTQRASEVFQLLADRLGVSSEDADGTGRL